MAALTKSEHELVALGAAIASNCVPCTQFHIEEARKLGLSDSQILEAVEVANKVRQVPARKVLKVALSLLHTSDEATFGRLVDTTSDSDKDHPCCR